MFPSAPTPFLSWGCGKPTLLSARKERPFSNDHRHSEPLHVDPRDPARMQKRASGKNKRRYLYTNASLSPSIAISVACTYRPSNLAGNVSELRINAVRARIKLTLGSRDAPNCQLTVARASAEFSYDACARVKSYLLLPCASSLFIVALRVCVCVCVCAECLQRSQSARYGRRESMMGL